MLNLDQLMQLQDIRQIPELAKDKFCEIYRKKYKVDPEGFFEQQKNLYLVEISQGAYAEKLWKADRLSLFNAFISLAINGLSLEKGLSTECYLECRSICIGKDERGNKVYGNQAVITITGYGEISLRIRAGQITSTGKPVIVYDCDKFQDGEWDGKKVINYMRTIPRPQGAKKIACYFPINLKDGQRDYGIMYLEDIVRLAEYSKKFNGGRYANALYGKASDCSDVDDGFFIAKTIKHAFKTYPKLTIGDGAAMESDKDLDEPGSEGNQNPNPTQPSVAPETSSQGTQVNVGDGSPFE